MGYQAQELREISAEGTDYHSYFEQVKNANRSRNQKLLENLESFKGIKISVGIVGSDSRLEKGSVSPLEIIVISRDSKNQKIKDILPEIKKVNNLDPFIEYKNIMEKGIVYTRIGETEIISPNRIFDYLQIVGENALFKEAKQKLAEEIKESKTIKEAVRGKIKAHKRITRTGRQKYKGKVLVHFGEGIAYYDPKKHLRSFKEGPLRWVQWALVRDKIKAIRENEKLREIILYELPRNTVEAISFLESEGISKLSKEESADLKDIYKYFLWLYHLSQQKFKKDNKTEIEYDKKEVTERISSLEKLVARSFIKV